MSQAMRTIYRVIYRAELQWDDGQREWTEPRQVNVLGAEDDIDLAQRKAREYACNVAGENAAGRQWSVVGLKIAEIAPVATAQV